MKLQILKLFLKYFLNIIERSVYKWKILKDKGKKSDKYNYINWLKEKNAEIQEEYQYTNLIEKRKKG